MRIVNSPFSPAAWNMFFEFWMRNFEVRPVDLAILISADVGGISLGSGDYSFSSR